jgi:hypothetical protein
MKRECPRCDLLERTCEYCNREFEAVAAAYENAKKAIHDAPIAVSVGGSSPEQIVRAVLGFVDAAIDGAALRARAKEVKGG